VLRSLDEIGYDAEWNCIPAAAAGPGTLNPTWVEWLMGFPLGWTVLEPSETPSSRRSRKSSAGPSLSIQSAAFFPWALVSYLHGLPLMIAFDAVLALLDIRAILTWDRQRRSTLSIGPPWP
jgi:hypothetical protein